MPDFTDPAERLRARFSRARSMLDSFFSELIEVTSTMSPEERDSWCFNELKISSRVITQWINVLSKADAQRVRDELRFKRVKEFKSSAPKTQRPSRPTVRKETIASSRDKFLQEYVASRQGLSEGLKLSLEDVIKIEAKSRVELGAKFSMLRDMVKKGEAGLNPMTNKRWNWSEWGPLYLNRSRRDIHKCITEFGASCPKNLQKCHTGEPAQKPLYKGATDAHTN